MVVEPCLNAVFIIGFALKKRAKCLAIYRLFTTFT